MRGSWDQYFLEIALATAKRSTCPRLHVGAVLTYDRRIVSTGYNGSVHGQPHCDDIGCDLVPTNEPLPADPARPDSAAPAPMRCQRTVHAEANALLHGAHVDLSGAILYATHSPCRECFKLIAQVGISSVVYARPFYRDLGYGGTLGINLVHFAGVLECPKETATY